MSNPISSNPSTPVNPQPQQNMPSTPIKTPSAPITSGSAPVTNPSANLNPALSNSPWAKMFPGGATPQQLQQFINSFLKSMIQDFKRESQHWKEAQDKLKKVEQGDDPDS